MVNEQHYKCACTYCTFSIFLRGPLQCRMSAKTFWKSVNVDLRFLRQVTHCVLIVHPFPTPSFPQLPSPRYKLPYLRQGVLFTIRDLGLSGTWVYRGLGCIGGFCYQGKGNRGLGPVV